jgi:hypothetical protein
MLSRKDFYVNIITTSRSHGNFSPQKTFIFSLGGEKGAKIRISKKEVPTSSFFTYSIYKAETFELPLSQPGPWQFKCFEEHSNSNKPF